MKEYVMINLRLIRYLNWCCISGKKNRIWDNQSPFAHFMHKLVKCDWKYANRRAFQAVFFCSLWRWWKTAINSNGCHVNMTLAGISKQLIAKFERKNSAHCMNIPKFFGMPTDNHIASHRLIALWKKKPINVNNKSFVKYDKRA